MEGTTGSTVMAHSLIKLEVVVTSALASVEGESLCVMEVLLSLNDDVNSKVTTPLSCPPAFRGLFNQLSVGKQECIIKGLHDHQLGH